MIDVQVTIMAGQVQPWLNIRQACDLCYFEIRNSTSDVYCSTADIFIHFFHNHPSYPLVFTFIHFCKNTNSSSKLKELLVALINKKNFLCKYLLFLSFYVSHVTKLNSLKPERDHQKARMKPEEIFKECGFMWGTRPKEVLCWVLAPMPSFVILGSLLQWRRQ